MKPIEPQTHDSSLLGILIVVILLLIMSCLVSFAFNSYRKKKLRINYKTFFTSCFIGGVCSNILCYFLILQLTKSGIKIIKMDSFWLILLYLLISLGSMILFPLLLNHSRRDSIEK